MEFFDLYDKDRRKLGKTMVRGTFQPEGTYRLVVHICIFNSKGEMLIQQRQINKNGWSGLWDISAGGHAQTGEDSETAAHRELLEEIGVDIDFKNLRPALTVHWKNSYSKRNSQGFKDIYLINMNLDESMLKLQEEEVLNVKWANESQIIEMINNKLFIPYHPGFISYLFHLSKNSDSHTCADWTLK